MRASEPFSFEGKHADARTQGYFTFLDSKKYDNLCLAGWEKYNSLCVGPIAQRTQRMYGPPALGEKKGLKGHIRARTTRAHISPWLAYVQARRFRSPSISLALLVRRISLRETTVPN